ncbi:MAG: GEVED domain-containing protein [Bacteroidota bacterium]
MKNFTRSLLLSLSNCCRSTVIALLLFISSATQLSAQSDLCSAAPTLTPGTTCVNTAYTVQAAWGNEIAAPCGLGSSYRDGWYKFTAAHTYTTITASTNRTLALAVYSGTCGALTELSCAQTTGTTSIKLNTVIGTTYFIRLYRANNAQANTMTGNICVSESQYCTPAHTSCNTDYINRVTIGSVSNTTNGCSGSGYTRFTAPKFYGAKGCPINFTVACNPTWDENMAIWIDYNGDKDFADAGEKVYTAPTDLATHNGTFTIPATVADGTYALRVSITYTAATSADGCGSYTYGETEDYTITVGPGVTPSTPVATAASNIQCKNFNANWNQTASATNYFLDVATDAAFTAIVAGYNNLNVGMSNSF